MYKIIGADGKEYGPVTADQMLRWIAEGRANAGTRAQAEGTTDWKNLSEFPEFAAALSAKSLPPAMAVGAAAAPVDPDALAQQIIAGGVQISIGSCIERGWNLVKSDFWPIVGASAVAYLIIGALGIIAGPVMGGVYYYFLKRIRGQRVEFGDIFSGFTLAFLQLFLVALIAGILQTIGFFLCVIPGIYLMVAWIFAVPLVIDKKMDFWPAMELSRKVVNKVWWPVFGLLVLLWLIGMLGVVLCCVGIFVAFPVIVASLAYAYEDLFNRPGQTAA